MSSASAVYGSIYHSEMIVFVLLLGSDITAAHNRREDFSDK